MATQKIYNSFSDKYGNKYRFESFVDFASFWFNMSRRTAAALFPEFTALQKCAYNSREARKKLS